MKRTPHVHHGETRHLGFYVALGWVLPVFLWRDGLGPHLLCWREGPPQVDTSDSELRQEMALVKVPQGITSILTSCFHQRVVTKTVHIGGLQSRELSSRERVTGVCRRK
eukprot:6298246-Amphidinium_carterae.1